MSTSTLRAEVEKTCRYAKFFDRASQHLVNHQLLLSPSAFSLVVIPVCTSGGNTSLGLSFEATSTSTTYLVPPNRQCRRLMPPSPLSHDLEVPRQQLSQAQAIQAVGNYLELF